MIVDSSAWIAHVRGTGSPVARRLASALEEHEPVWLPDIVLMEVLRGARNAARLYARCRWDGFTPRCGSDCIIACCAIEAGEPLLHEDRDFPGIAAIEPSLVPWDGN